MDSQILLKLAHMKADAITTSVLLRALNKQETSFSFQQTSHGFVRGDWLYYDATGANWQKADRDDSRKLAQGIVSSVVGTDEFNIAFNGILTGFEGLTPQAPYYLSSTAGAMTATASDTGINQIVGFGLSDNRFRIAIQESKVPSLQSDRLQVDGRVNIAGDSEFDGYIKFNEQSVDPANPPEGQAILWMSDGTGSGDDGDIMIKITAGATTKTVTLIDFSAS